MKSVSFTPVPFIRKHFNSFQTILIEFMCLILIGSALLSLPFASADHQPVPFINALFTSTSAVCVTGLVVYDTATQWSIFGRTVILILIQIGGIGVVSMTVLLMIATGRRIGIFQRLTMQDAISAPQIGGIVRFTRFFLKGTVLIEGLGTILLLPPFVKEFGIWKGLGYALFHSISAFCNAGFDLMGMKEPFSSFTHYYGHTWISLVLILLIVVGGLGFMTWQDLLKNKFRQRGLRLQTKIILCMTLILITLPFLYFFFIEYARMPLSERFTVSLFQAVTPRTAGFNTMPYNEMSESGLLITIVLMMVGGAPGSTAGGMKLTTLFILLASTHANLRHYSNVNAFHRRIEPDIIHNAFTVITVYVTLLLIGTVLLSGVERIPVIHAMFECASALGTVGLTTGITPGLKTISKIILIGFMFLGRTGGLTIAFAMVSNSKRVQPRMPSERITVG
ncbi:MAG: Trk family potassium uptake protein [Solobacterium sp.]|nr:Trk family potassium uptake protein [Solobacterium sp.]